MKNNKGEYSLAFLNPDLSKEWNYNKNNHLTPENFRSHYLKLREGKLFFYHHVNIGLGKCICDFYIQDINKYVEITGYSETWDHWDAYYKNILKKQEHIVNNLKSGFEFIKIKLTLPQIIYVKKNMET